MRTYIQIARDKGLIPELPQTSVDDVVLTEEEANQALKIALSAKQGRIASEQYARKVNAMNTIPPLSSGQYYETVLERAKDIIPGFTLTTELEDIYQLLSFYFTNDMGFEKAGYKLNKGLMLCGNVGCGKTSIMRMFNLNPKASYVILSCRKIASDYTEQGENVLYAYSGEYYPIMIENPFKAEGWAICFDDLGTEENKKHFGNQVNVMENIILNRYDNETTKRKTHITTNLDTNQIEEIYGSRVRSRMREMFNVIPVGGGDMRK